jgi:hypothetical protein
MSERPRVERVAEEPGDKGPVWESWCRAHPLPNGDTGVLFDTWLDAMEHATTHAREHHVAHRPEPSQEEA